MKFNADCNSNGLRFSFECQITQTIIKKNIEKNPCDSIKKHKRRLGVEEKKK